MGMANEEGTMNDKRWLMKKHHNKSPSLRVPPVEVGR